MKNYLIALMGRSALSTSTTRGHFLVVIVLGLLASAIGSPGQVRHTGPIPIARPCCVITAINASTGVVTAKENATGKIFQFKLNDATLLNSLKIGQGAYANFTANQVSLDGNKACCTIITPSAPPAPLAGAAPPPAANKTAPRLAPVPGAAPVAAGQIQNKPTPCCDVTAINTNTGVVTARENAIGKIFQFKVTDAALLNSLQVGQGIYANFGAQQVSLNGSVACCKILSVAAAPSNLSTAGEPPGSIASPAVQRSTGGSGGTPPAGGLQSTSQAVSGGSPSFSCDGAVCHCSGGRQSEDCQNLSKVCTIHSDDCESSGLFRCWCVHLGATGVGTSSGASVLAGEGAIALAPRGSTGGGIQGETAGKGPESCNGQPKGNAGSSDSCCTTGMCTCNGGPNASNCKKVVGQCDSGGLTCNGSKPPQCWCSSK